MYTINCSKIITDFEGETIKDGISDKDFTVGKALTSLLGQTEGDALKIFTLQQKFYKGGKVEIDAADFDMVKEATKATSPKFLNNTIKGQILVALSEAKEEVTSAKKKK